MENATFRIKTYSWNELARYYNPGITSRAATNQLAIWITRNKELTERLRQSGWQKGFRVLTPAQVALIVEYLGEP